MNFGTNNMGWVATLQKNIFVLLLLSVTLAGHHVWAQNVTPTKKSTQSTGLVTLNFTEADVDSVARSVANMTGSNVVVDPRVKGKITLVSENPVSVGSALNQFSVALRLKGYTLVESKGLYRVVPESEGKIQTNLVSVPGTDPDKIASVRGGIVTKIFKLDFEPAQNLVPILRPLITPNNIINANPSNNTLIITDYSDNLTRLGRIIASMDVPNATDVEVLNLKYAIASDLAPLVLRLVEASGGTGGNKNVGNEFKTVIEAESRSNSLILRAANRARLDLIKSLIEKLDQPGTQGNNATGNIHVVYLKNANATSLANTLRAALSGQVNTPTTTQASNKPIATPKNLATTGGQVQADEATNSLIVTASAPQYKEIRALIDQLDTPRAQVYVESLIAEVNTDKAAEFGVQWQGILGKNGSTVGILGTNFGAGAGNILNIATGIKNGNPSLARGANIGVTNNSNGNLMLGLLANFIQSSGSGNVLSTPNLLTLDNEEAKIVIGQNVPFVTGQFTNANTSSGSVNPFQTVERKDVGLTLRVKPQISENGTVRLSIYQEVSSLQASTLNASNGPTTNKRTIETNVIVQDGSVVVLGGLLQDSYAGSDEKVPGISEVPVFGNLFKSESRSRTKTNLMVFLRPVVVRTANASDKLSMDRYDLMRSGMKSTQPVPSETVPVNGSAQLPSLSAVEGNSQSGLSLRLGIDMSNATPQPIPKISVPLSIAQPLPELVKKP